MWSLKDVSREETLELLPGRALGNALGDAVAAARRALLRCNACCVQGRVTKTAKQIIQNGGTGSELRCARWRMGEGLALPPESRARAVCALEGLD